METGPMKRTLTVALAVLALAACQREVPAPVAADATAPAAAPATDATPVVATETTMAQAGVQPGPGAIDNKAFAGKFSGTLPCADCPGIDETLELGTDGNFTLTDVYRERPQGTFTMQGTWSTDADGKRIRLDPGNKAEVDRLFAIDDNDTLTLLGADGEPAQGAPAMHLKRGK
jgi:copper homeostasis protein (lipoprotein)